MGISGPAERHRSQARHHRQATAPILRSRPAVL